MRCCAINLKIALRDRVAVSIQPAPAARLIDMEPYQLRGGNARKLEAKEASPSAPVSWRVHRARHSFTALRVPPSAEKGRKGRKKRVEKKGV